MNYKIYLFLRRKWSIPIMFNLRNNKDMKISEIKKIFPNSSEKMLIETLDFLLQENIVKKKTYNTYPRHTEYSLTPYGKALSKQLIEIKKLYNQFNLLEIKEKYEKNI